MLRFIRSPDLRWHASGFYQCNVRRTGRHTLVQRIAEDSSNNMTKLILILIYLTSGLSSQPVNVSLDARMASAVATGGYQETPMFPGDLTISAVASARWQFIPGQGGK